MSYDAQGCFERVPILKRNVVLNWNCQACNARLSVELISEPSRTGAMSTVDCPLCGASKMIPDTPTKVFYQKDGQWIEVKPRSQYA